MQEAVLEEEHEAIVEVDKLNTHQSIMKNNAYKIIALQENYAKISLDISHCERVSENGLIYDGVVFSAATFVATAAINEKNMFLIGVDLDLLTPLKEEAGTIILEASSQQTSSGKKMVKVTGKINEVVFLEGSFSLLKLDEKSLIK